MADLGPVLVDGYSDVPVGKLASVVTCLEMRARPPLRAERAAAHGDDARGIKVPWTLKRVVRPETRWYRELFQRIGGDWLWFGRLKLPPSELAAILESPSVEIYALSVDDRDEGLLELDFRQPETCELAYFGLTRQVQGAGAGRFLMNRAIDLAWQHPIGRFWVHTCTLDHPDALGFYLRSGFRAYARRIEIADDPRLTGLLPKTAASHVPVIEAPVRAP